VVLVIKNLPANKEDIRDTGSVPGLGRSAGGNVTQIIEIQGNSSIIFK